MFFNSRERHSRLHHSRKHPYLFGAESMPCSSSADAYGYLILSVRASVETTLAFTASGVKQRSSQPFCE